MQFAILVKEISFCIFFRRNAVKHMAHIGMYCKLVHVITQLSVDCHLLVIYTKVVSSIDIFLQIALKRYETTGNRNRSLGSQNVTWDVSKYVSKMIKNARLKPRFYRFVDHIELDKSVKSRFQTRIFSSFYAYILMYRKSDFEIPKVLFRFPVVMNSVCFLIC